MAKQAITFPKVKGTNVWRNARTGTLIQRSEPGNGDGTYYSVLAPSIEPGGRHVIAVPRLAEAREIAVGVATAVLERREADHAEALRNAPVVEHIGQLVRFRHDFSDKLIGFEFVIDGLSRMAADGRRVARIKHYRKGRGWAYRLARLDDLRTLPDGRLLAPHAGHDGIVADVA